MHKLFQKKQHLSGLPICRQRQSSLINQNIFSSFVGLSVVIKVIFLSAIGQVQIRFHISANTRLKKCVLKKRDCFAIRIRFNENDFCIKDVARRRKVISCRLLFQYQQHWPAVHLISFKRSVQHEIAFYFNHYFKRSIQCNSCTKRRIWRPSPVVCRWVLFLI